jgi:hypothetical protein
MERARDLHACARRTGRRLFFQIIALRAAEHRALDRQQQLARGHGVADVRAHFRDAPLDRRADVRHRFRVKGQLRGHGEAFRQRAELHGLRRHAVAAHRLRAQRDFVAVLLFAVFVAVLILAVAVRLFLAVVVPRTGGGVRRRHQGHAESQRQCRDPNPMHRF